MSQTYQQAYNDFIDEITPEIKIWSLRYSPSHVLREVDPTAYRGGFVDWTDRMICADCGTEYSADVEEDDEYAPLCDDCRKATLE